MFICSKCENKTDLPACNCCEHAIVQENNIWQLSDMPDLVTEGNGDKYIGYEHIGESYSGNRKYVIEEKDSLFAKEVAEMTGAGIFLDLACGDGCITVPCAAYGIRIIAGDISNAMLSILQKKAQHNNISLDQVTLCRMNALEIPLESESVDTVIANSVLHLISSPQKVVSEIYRVLKKGGRFICRDDRPGASNKEQFDNEVYNQRVGELYNNYWTRLLEEGIRPKKYSWTFDRDAICKNLFNTKEEKLIVRGNVFEMQMKDNFLPRFCGRGFSDQVDVPQNLHDKVIEQILSDFKLKYGDEFTTIAFKGIEEDLLITTYIK